MKEHINALIDLDKWLYLANIFKTIELAQEAILNGNIVYNGQVITHNISIENFSKIKIISDHSETTLMVTDLVPPTTNNQSNAESMYIRLSLSNDTVTPSKNYTKHRSSNYLTTRKNVHLKPATKKSRFLRRSITEYKKQNINNDLSNLNDS